MALIVGDDRSTEAHAGTASAVGQAFDATVRISDYAEASIGTSLAPRLMAVAMEAAVAAGDLRADPNARLERCLVAILCAHAALEADMNEVGDELDREWWAARERWKVERKWAALIEKRSGTKPPRGAPARKAVKRLTIDRNRVAHFRGVPQRGGSIAVAGPPVESGGKGSRPYSLK